LIFISSEESSPLLDFFDSFRLSSCGEMNFLDRETKTRTKDTSRKKLGLQARLEKNIIVN